MSLGDNIKTARINKGLNQKELADLISTEEDSVGHTSISNWENNINKPDADTIAILCKVLDVDANYLLDFKLQDIKEDNPETQLIKQYKILFDKDDRLTQEEKNFMINYLETKHKEIDKELDKKE